MQPKSLIVSLLATFALTLPLRADHGELRGLSRDVTDAARSLRDATDDYLDHLYDNPDADKTLVEQRLVELEATVERFRTALSQDGANPAECPAGLVAAGFNHDYAAQKCAAAGVNAGRFKSCAVELVQNNFNHDYAGQKCLAAGANAATYGRCAVIMIGSNYNHDYAGQKCMTAAANAEIFGRCSAKLVELSYNHDYAAQKCLAAGPKGRTFSQCVEAMRAQNYNHDYAATYCLNNG